MNNNTVNTAGRVSKNRLKKILCAAYAVLQCAFFSAMPGVQDFMPTEAGQYVYYRDYTFSAETYIGFLQYDEGTYAARYYAPDVKVGLSDIRIFFTLDTSKDFPEFTGEKIDGKVSADDVTAVNYIHDLLYEFAARRKKMNGSDFSKSIRNTETYVQFGGEVTVTYDFYVPVFNISRIQDNTGKTLCEVVCINEITDSEDTSFLAFKGFPAEYPDVKAGKKISKSAAAKLDAKWQEVGEQVWFLDSDALCYTAIQEIDHISFDGKPYTPLDFAVRSFFMSSDGNYSCVPCAKIVRTENSVTVRNVQYVAASKSWTHDIKILRKNQDGTYRISGITIYAPFYAAHKPYFDTVVSRLLK